MNKLPSMLILIGLTGAGKSTVALMIEKLADAGRVRRFTTRPPRLDDDPSLVVTTSRLEPEEGDFQYSGWGEHKYLIKWSDIAGLQRGGITPIVEMGEFDAARTLGDLFGQYHIVLVRRPFSDIELAALFRDRHMNSDEIEERLNSLREDEKDLAGHLREISSVIENSGSLLDLRSRVISLLGHLEIQLNKSHLG